MLLHNMAKWLNCLSSHRMYEILAYSLASLIEHSLNSDQQMLACCQPKNAGIDCGDSYSYLMIPIALYWPQNAFWTYLALHTFCLKIGNFSEIDKCFTAIMTSNTMLQALLKSALCRIWRPSSENEWVLYGQAQWRIYGISPRQWESFISFSAVQAPGFGCRCICRTQHFWLWYWCIVAQTPSPQGQLVLPMCLWLSRPFQ